MKTSILYSRAQDLGAGFVANVILNWHRNPVRKLRGLIRLLEQGKTVSIAGNAIDILLVDGNHCSWASLELIATS